MSDVTLGKIYGVGTGPGDPDLLTLKAVKALNKADVLAFFTKRGSRGNGRTIVEAHVRAGILELPLVYPVTVEEDKDSDSYKRAIDGFFDQSAAEIAVHLRRAAMLPC